MTVTPLSDTTYQHLIDYIEREGLAPDSRLPSEALMAEIFGVSRPVVRQALARLRAEGRVYARRGSGNFVGTPPPVQNHSFEPLASVADIRSFLEFRLLIEGESAARAALCVDGPMMENITLRRRQLEAALAKGETGIEEDIAFHTAIAQASGNRFILMTMSALAEQTRVAIRLVRDLSPQPGFKRSADIRREHRDIDDAIRLGDSRAAHAAMTAHLRGGLARLFG